MRFRLGYNRVHGAAAILQDKAASARMAAFEADLHDQGMFAASLRGKAKAFDESAALLLKLERDRPLGRRRWVGPR